MPWQCFSSQAVALPAVRQTEISYVVPPTPVTFLTLVCLLGVPEGVPRWQSRAWPFSCPLTLPGPRSSLCGENIKKQEDVFEVVFFQLYPQLLSSFVLH